MRIYIMTIVSVLLLMFAIGGCSKIGNPNVVDTSGIDCSGSPDIYWAKKGNVPPENTWMCYDWIIKKI